MVKIPSINTIVGGALATVRRFPMTLLCAVSAACILVYLTHNEWRDANTPLFYTLGRILMCCELGLCIFLAFSLVSEARRHSMMTKIIWQAIALALVTGYYFTIGDLDKFDMVRVTRYCMFVIAAHLFVSFAPFIGNGQINGFWQYNKTLFLRILLASLYTVVLYGGISLALWSIDVLLHVNINYKKYLYVWYFLACVFNTCFFLAGLPRNIEDLDKDTSYLKGLKAFTQYVLLPLVTVYLVILYIYIGKIILEWKLPKGLVSYLVIGYSVAGIFSLLLIYPIRNNDENRWIRIFSRWFYFALYPLIILLCISIFDRIADYGITENRYFILVLAFWLFGIASYFLNGRRENIKIIPVSLCFIAFFTSFGPWGAFSVAEHSQKNHLEEILTKNKILVNGKVDKKTVHNVTAEESDEIWSVVEYLDNSSSLDMIQPWFDNIKIDSIKYGKASTLVTEMNIVSNSNKDMKTVYYYRKVGSYSTYTIDIKGFDTFSAFSGNYYSRSTDTNKRLDTIPFGYFMIGTDSFAVYPVQNSTMYTIRKHRKDVAQVDLNGFIKHLSATYDTNKSQSYRDITVPNDKFMLDVETDSLQIRFLFKNITTEENHDKIKINQVEADLLTRHK